MYYKGSDVSIKLVRFIMETRQLTSYYAMKPAEVRTTAHVTVNAVMLFIECYHFAHEYVQFSQLYVNEAIALELRVCKCISIIYRVMNK